MTSTKLNNKGRHVRVPNSQETVKSLIAWYFPDI